MDQLFSLFREPFSFKEVRLYSDGGGSGDDAGTDDKGTDDSGKDTGGDKNTDTGDQESKDTGKTFDEKYVKELRDEAAKYRTERKQYADDKQKLENQIKSIQKALGLEGDEPDADKLQAELQAKETELRSLKIENVFSKVARKVGADEELTLAVLHRKGKLNDLDLGDNLASSLEELVKQALEDNPKLKAESTNQTNTGDSAADSGGSSKTSFNDIIRKAAGRA